MTVGFAFAFARTLVNRIGVLENHDNAILA